MSISTFFIERPIFTTLTAFGILLFGIVGYRALPVAALPSVDYPTIQVQAALPGASPDTMASSVATPLETPVFDDCRNRLDELVQFAWQHQHNHPI